MYRYLSLIPVLLYTQLSGILSSFYVEFNNVYITEIQQAVDFEYSSFFYAVSFLIVVSVYVFIAKKSEFWFACRKELIVCYPDSAVIRFIFGFICFLCIHIYVSGAPAFNQHINRFNFWNDYAKIPIIATVLGDLSLPLILILGVIKANIDIGEPLLKKSNRLVNFAAAFYFFHLFLLGHKFNGFVLAGLSYYSPIIYSRLLGARKAISKSELSYLVLFLIFGGVLTLFFFKNSEGGIIDLSGGSAIQAVLYRVFALQGYYWPALWPIRSQCGIDWDLGLMQNAIFNLAAFPDFYIENRINLANVFPAILLCSKFGYFNIIISSVLMGLWLGFLFGIFSYFFKGYQYISSAITLQLIVTTCGAYPSGDYGNDYFLKIFLLFLLLISITIFKSLKR